MENENTTVTISEIVDELGGSSFVARRLNLGASTVGQWKVRDFIRPQYWDALIALAIELDKSHITADYIMRAHPAVKIDGLNNPVRILEIDS